MMSKMTYKQIDHARQRLSSIKRSLLGPAPKPVETYETNDLVEALDDGAVLSQTCVSNAAKKYIQGRVQQTYRYGVTKALDACIVDEFFKPQIAKDAARYERESRTYDARCKVVMMKANDVEDQIVLGDQQAALIALQAFAQITV